MNDTPSPALSNASELPPSDSGAVREAPDASSPADPWNTPEDTLAWEEGVRSLRSHPRFGALVERVGPVRLPPPDPSPFRALARSIAFQQLAGRAAATIWGRVEEALGGEITPGTVGEAPDELLRGAGLSRAKVAALRDLAAHAGEGRISFEALREAEDAEVVKTLVRIRGIGPWTARMHLIFQLRRPDVWPVGDLGVRVGWARVHGEDPPPDARALEPLGEAYRPWRSAVAWYCWRVVDTGLEVPRSAG